MSNHLHPLMKQRIAWNYANPLAGRDGWVSDLVMWYGSSNVVNRGIKPCVGVW